MARIKELRILTQRSIKAIKGGTKLVFRSPGSLNFSRSQQTFCVIIENETGRRGKLEIKDYNVKING